jgi:ElaB/YqjD/DUF883 family membrane-anchored ribosome-binding protein
MPKQTKEMENIQRQLAELTERLTELSADTADDATDFMENTREHLEEAVRMIKEKSGEAKERVVKAGKDANTYVHENPWQTAAIAGATGILIGLLLSRSHKDEQ